MILFPRATARDFRVLFGRCVAGRPRGPAPPVVIQFEDDIRTLAATTAEGVTLTHTSPALKEADDLLVLPAAVLAEVEGGTDKAVSLDRETKLRGVVRWRGGAEPRTLPVELILPGRQHELPTPPPLSTVPATLLAALHECGRTAAKESGRFALSKVQLQGKSGRVVGMDGKVALLWTGFTLPFADDVLIPALPVFGSKSLVCLADVKLGRTATHLVVAADAWAVWLPTDTRAKYPDVAGVVPRHAPATVRIDPSDAAALLPVLPGLPGGDHDLRPVTLDADRGRARPRAGRGRRDGGGVAGTLDVFRFGGPCRPRPPGAGPCPRTRLSHRPSDPRPARRPRRQRPHAGRGATRPRPDRAARGRSPRYHSLTPCSRKETAREARTQRPHPAPRRPARPARTGRGTAGRAVRRRGRRDPAGRGPAPGGRRRRRCCRR